MKTAIKLHIPLSFLLFIISCSTINAQDKKLGTSSLIEGKLFAFKVQTISPASGTTRQSTSDYDLRILGDSLISYLPYFGRAYSAPMPGESGGYNFTSTKFEYVAKKRKKGGWEISIKPEDVRDFREFSLNISEKGYGTLRAFSNNRQNISYDGYITAVK